MLSPQALADPGLNSAASDMVRRIDADPEKPARIGLASLPLIIEGIVAAVRIFQECKAKGQPAKTVARAAKRPVRGRPLRRKLQAALDELRTDHLENAASLTEFDPYWLDDDSPKHLAKHVIDMALDLPEDRLEETQRRAELYLPATEE
jgi:hypothetical protein